MVKISRSFTVDVEIYMKARSKGINLSEAAEWGIMNMANIKDLEGRKKTDSMVAALELMSDGDKESCMSCVGRDPGFSKGWKNRIKTLTGINVTETEIIEVFGKRR